MTDREYYTTWGSVRGCCGHLHQTLEAAEACIQRDARAVRRYNGPNSYSDRHIRAISGRADLQGWDVTRGPNASW